MACVWQENTTILRELVALRAQKSSLLGFRTHADYVLEMNMAQNGQAVATFLGNQPGPGLLELGHTWAHLRRVWAGHRLGLRVLSPG